MALLLGGGVLTAHLHAQQSQWDGLNQHLAELYSNGRYEEGVPLATEALQIAETTFGPEHPNVATSLNNLAEMDRSLGRYEEAKPLYQRALRLAETALGPESTLLAATLSNLAEMYRMQGEYGQAEPLYRRAIA
ncbi:MAG: tetratricopeptide repeat protein, partial [Acidobacteria bacterium]|nr:tetratricopeptide repeat protein [Acidobacteriota bacterium]